MRLDFPFMLYDELEKNKVLEWSINVNNSSFHSKSCYLNNFTFSTIEKATVCNKCEQLKYNNDIKQIIKRSNEYEEHTNYKYLSSNQFVEKLKRKNEQINEYKLTNLNQRAQLINLKNSKNDYERLVTLLSQNDIPGVCRLIKVCLRANKGINALINTVVSAINGKLIIQNHLC